MKNLMKQPIKMTTESWPSRKPCVNERLCTNQQIVVCISVFESSRGLLWLGLRRSIWGGVSYVNYSAPILRGMRLR